MPNGGYNTYVPNGQGGTINYARYIPQAQQRYLQLIYGPGGPNQYIAGQVRGAASAFQPYYNQMSTQGAAGAAARGGSGGGAQDYLLSKLQGEKTGALTQAATGAQRDVTATGIQALGLGQQEAGMMSADERAKLQYDLQKAIFEWQKKQAKSQKWFDLVGDIFGAGGTALGALL